jgi:GT2 family glycosyltransferase
MASSTQLAVSIIIPTAWADDGLRRCLLSVTRANPPASEVVVAVDGADSAACDMAASFGALVVTTPVRGGPSGARNVGAQAARGDILFFVDSDVLIPSDAVARVQEAFAARPDLAAIFGSYDDEPDAPNFLSQYKNLLHHYVHQTGREDASTFWAGCGAIRKEALKAVGGFDTAYQTPSMEDIELGYRLRAAGRKIRLVKSLQVKHLKHWTAGTLLRADFLARALPWSRLILKSGVLINDLNINRVSRLCAVLVYGLLLTLGLAVRWPRLLWMALVQVVALLALNWPLYRFFWRKRGLLFALAVVPWHWFYYFYGALAFGIAWLVHLFGRPESQPVSPLNSSSPREGNVDGGG